MTFDDDYIQYAVDGNVRRHPCKLVRLDWPPAETLNMRFLTWDGNDAHDITYSLKRLRFSSITDDERAQMTHVCRGAEYEVVSTEERPIPKAEEPNG
jgi:hypothetical protein